VGKSARANTGLRLSVSASLYSEKWFYQKLNYLHENPVRKGFVTKPEDWKYSSAKNWLLDDHS